MPCRPPALRFRVAAPLSRVVAARLRARRRRLRRRSRPTSRWSRSLGVYKLDINQGNYLTQDMVDKLKEGQTRAQVRVDPRHAARSPARSATTAGTTSTSSRARARSLEHRAFTVFFDGDKLARWEGDEMPQSMAELNRAALDKSMGHVPSADDPGVRWRWLFGDLLRATPLTMGVRIAIAGAGGRMGQALIEATLADPTLTLAAAHRRAGSAVDRARRRRAHSGAPTGVVVAADVGRRASRAADVLIDFTRPDGTLAHLAACARAGCAMPSSAPPASTPEQKASDRRRRARRSRSSSRPT